MKLFKDYERINVSVVLKKLMRSKPRKADEKSKEISSAFPYTQKIVANN